MSLHLVLTALALASALEGSRLDDGARAPVPPAAEGWLAQAGDEGFGDAPPLPPAAEDDAALDEPLGDAPPLPAPTLGEGEGASPAPAADVETAPPDEPAEDEGGGVIVTRALQYAAGFGTLVACTGVGCLGLVCASPCLVTTFQPFAFTLPWLGPCVSAALLTGVGAGSGAAAGAVEGVVGDAFGSETGGFVWPALAAAGTGAGLLALFSGAALASQLATARFIGQDPLALRFDSTFGCLFASTAVALAGLYLVATPLAGLLAYGLTAAPAPPDAPGAAAPSAGPAAPGAPLPVGRDLRASVAMAF